jgi:hypothetical protein
MLTPESGNIGKKKLSGLTPKRFSRGKIIPTPITKGESPVGRVLPTGWMFRNDQK